MKSRRTPVAPPQAMPSVLRTRLRGAVGAHQVAGAHALRGSALHGLHGRLDGVALVLELQQLAAVAQVVARAALRVPPQDRPRRTSARCGAAAPPRSRSRPGLRILRTACARRRQRQPGQLVAGVAGEVGDVGRMVRAAGPAPARRRRSPSRRKCSMVRAWVALACGLKAVPGLGSTSSVAHAAPSEFVGEHQPARAAAGDEYVRVQGLRHLAALL